MASFSLSAEKKFKATASAGKVMVTVFWDCEGVILIDVMPRGSTINSEAYVNTLTKLKKRFQRLRRHNNPVAPISAPSEAPPPVPIHAPAPAPVKEKTPEPVKEKTPELVKPPAPAPVEPQPKEAPKKAEVKAKIAPADAEAIFKKMGLDFNLENFAPGLEPTSIQDPTYPGAQT
nr:unnamed protein product [Callosobruchus analis]